MWIDPFADNSRQSKICSNCGQDNEAIELVQTHNVEEFLAF